MITLSKVTSLLLASALALSPFADASPVKRSSKIEATVKNGTVSGLYLPTFDQEVFYGLPYAQPPVGNLRLRQSLAINTSFDGVKALTTRVPQCAGVGSDDWGYELSEDCLYMNVLRPAGTKEGDDLPVALWIHGGGYYEGGINDMRYNGSWMVSRAVEMGKPLLHVAIAYRLTAYGFLNTPDSAKLGLQNMGLHDQRRALHYVQENIKAFGGDPSKVTIWGESAGAMSVSAHLMAYGQTESSLFRGAIMESGSPTTENYAYYNETATAPILDQILTNLSCADAKDQLQCLREVPYLEFNASIAQTDMWFPVIDGTLIKESPTTQMSKGEYVHVPMLLGANTDEGTAFGVYGTNTDDDMRAAMRAQWPGVTNASIEKVLELYVDDNMLGAPFGSGDAYLPTGRQDKRSCAIFGDVEMVGPRRHLAQTTAKKQSKVFSYRFDQPPTYYGLTAGYLDLGTTHFQEVSYVYGNPVNNRTGDAELSKYMMSAWIAMVVDQDPNEHGLKDEPTWPEYATNATNMVFRRQGRWVEEDTFREDGIAFLTSIGAEIGK